MASRHASRTIVLVLDCCCAYEPPGTRCSACLRRAHDSCHDPLVKRVPSRDEAVRVMPEPPNGADDAAWSGASGASDLPDLDLCPTISCGRDSCSGTVDGDGTSWWCATCGGTWDIDGTGGTTA